MYIYTLKLPWRLVMIVDKMTNSDGTTIVCNPYHKTLSWLFIKPSFYTLKIQEYIQVQDIMLGIQILLGSKTYSFWYISNKMQHYTVYLFLESCPTCYGWYLHPSSGAHTTVFTVSGTFQTVTATCRYCGTGLSVVCELHCFGAVADASGMCIYSSLKYVCAKMFRKCNSQSKF